MFPLPHYFLAGKLSGRWRLAKPATSKPFDQSRIDQQTVETARLRTPGASIEQPVTAFQDIFLFGKGRIKRHTCRLLHQQRQVRCIERLECRRQIDRPEIYGVDCVVARVVARIKGFQLSRNRRLAERRIDDAIGKFRLMISEANDQEKSVGKSCFRRASSAE